MLLTPDGRVILYRVSTGERFVRWPVDARGMLETGDYSLEPTAGTVPAASLSGDALSDAPIAEPVAHVTQALADAAALSPTGAPLVIAPAASITPAAPMGNPVRTKGKV